MGDFHDGEIAVQLRKVDPNEIGSLEHFPFVRWYVELVQGPYGDKLEGGVSIEYVEEAERTEDYEKIVKAFD